MWLELEILRILLKKQYIDLYEILAELEVSPKEVYWAAKRLEALGILGMSYEDADT